MFAEYLAAGAATGPVRIARFDPSTGRLSSSRAFAGVADTAFAGGLLWVGGPVPRSGGTRGLLYGVDPRTLSVDRVIALPAKPLSLAPTPTGLWAGCRRHLYRIDTVDGGVLRSVRIRGDADRLAVAPSGTVLYVARNTPGSAHALPPEERDATSGALLVTSMFDPGYAANWLAATDGGVWLSSAIGKFGAAFFLHKKGLKALPWPIESDQGVVASLAGGWLWIPLDLGRTLICADPVDRGSSRRVSHRAPCSRRVRRPTNVVAVGRSTFIGTGAGIMEVPASECAPLRPLDPRWALTGP